MENDDGLLERRERVQMVDEHDTEPPVVEKKKRQYKKKNIVPVPPVTIIEEAVVEVKAEVKGSVVGESLVPVKPEKVKKPRTEAQVLAFEKARASRDANRKKNMELKEQQTEEKILTKVLKDKVIKKKATKITKLKNELINEIIESDSEDESVVPEPVVQRRKSVAVPVKPRITFV